MVAGMVRQADPKMARVVAAVQLVVERLRSAQLARDRRDNLADLARLAAGGQRALPRSPAREGARPLTRRRAFP